MLDNFRYISFLKGAIKPNNVPYYLKRVAHNPGARIWQDKECETLKQVQGDRFISPLKEGTLCFTLSG